jgi:hypothetical protein
VFHFRAKRLPAFLILGPDWKERKNGLPEYWGTGVMEYWMGVLELWGREMPARQPGNSKISARSDPFLEVAPAF